MRTTSKITAAVAATAALTLGLSACGTASDPQDSPGATGEGPLTVAASPTPHAAILEYVRDHLAEKEGLDLKVKVVNDYVLPNTATESGDVDANYFQHKPYLDDFQAKNGTHITPVVNVHLEPLGLYAETADGLEDIKAGHTIALPNDTTNGGRALQLLDAHGLIELAEGAGQDATLADIADRKGLEFKELEAATVPRALGEVDAAVINGNYALEAGLAPAEDALVLEEAEGNPYANFLAVKEGNEDDPRVVKLAQLLTSDEVRAYIEKEYGGSVVPASGTAGD
ncbi:MetQ/NlpA family ABC transporter substrate-binding protein [Streptomyces sp. TRM 70351]|uniref:MetQ/NlpA family ABC transporter substrate-binding protein n=1 Tax=Streptomyces sp. TRM 70351 TaxID=3116552 RepID=UPI002E7B0CED|nr:MetQ/NlpA family ABC transporter substrate-binding protein [Streptomyces sp. TRM 70351]MEE1929108.1 MetQ/NlpA family ABC transporter substrate-binding protein [Streptomyces sp. TRM 70351]